jgi:transcriptional regulator with XRE-family HTH domain
MKLNEYRKKIKQDPKFITAKKELQPFLNLGNNVLILRLTKGWSQKELAEKIGTKQANISKIEAAISNPSLKIIHKIANIFNVEAYELLIDSTDYPHNKISSDKVETMANNNTDSVAIPILNWPGYKKQQINDSNDPKFSTAEERKVDSI